MRCLACCLLASAVLVTMAVAGPAWPPVSGEAAGNVTLPWLADAPPLAWRVQARPEASAGVAVELTATAPGLALKLEAIPPAGDAAGSWRVVSGTVDVASWWRVAASQIKASAVPPDLELGGNLEVTGAGTWRGAEFAGTISATLTAGTARSAAQSWEAGGITLAGVAELKSGGVTLRSAQLRAETAQAAGISARNLLIEAVAGDDGRLAVRRAEIVAFGGRIALAPFTLDPAAPAVRTTAEFSGVALGELAALVPQALTEARGQVAGRITVNWSLQAGVEPGAGSLVVSPDTPATLRLAKSPGLLTGRSPPRIEFLPAWTGPLHTWFSVENPGYDLLRRIELGDMPLVVEHLDVRLYPDGPDAARSATVEISARPASGEAVKKVTFTVNLSGPLAQVLRLGLDDRAKVRVNTLH